ncbi:SMR family transporter [Devosia sp. J2-20]|jgi:multidrug transporter EmrE-like cation transporter|uniref:EamA family transporter n=1 Tax=Devosia litorisediminis TaxID=2829817 RepID=A0A942E7X0_9HYPH|nr:MULTISPECIES: SMR family transporter [Devosia]MBS3847469.1 EamA family transporter [Devosia litorisediminis]MCZ4347170.1 SMR family transporter [Devosia neptuniae]WDQ99410.1 SMR family transporter [Devosia sp. J2-20]|tara:strand:+ start:359 stop:691 length:333 start_codon:yes stop_codon:yes gene_type:complete
MNGGVLLAIAIVGEVVATSFLRASNGFTELVPTLVVVIGYAITFYFFSLALQTIPVGIGYAIWSGTGIVLIALIAYFVHGQTLDLPAMIGMGLILSGVLVINLFSKSAAH